MKSVDYRKEYAMRALCLLFLLSLLPGCATYHVYVVQKDTAPVADVRQTPGSVPYESLGYYRPMFGPAGSLPYYGMPGPYWGPGIGGYGRSGFAVQMWRR